VAVWTAREPGARWGLEPYVARVRCPVLAVQGEEDEFFTAAQLEALQQLDPVGVERMRITGSGHYHVHQARNDVLAASIRLIRVESLSRPSASTAPSS